VQAGPSVVVGYLTKEFILGVFPQQWFSIGGSPARPDTSQLNLQPFANLFFFPLALSRSQKLNFQTVV